MGADGMRTLEEELELSSIDSAIRGTILLASLPNWYTHQLHSSFRFRSVIAILLHYIFRFKRSASILVKTGHKSVSETWELQRQRRNFQRLFYEKWSSCDIDALICPANATVSDVVD